MLASYLRFDSLWEVWDLRVLSLFRLNERLEEAGTALRFDLELVPPLLRGVL